MKLKSITALSAVIFTITYLTSCATIMHGTRQSISLATNPTNACVWVDRNFMGYTPIVVEMSRKNNHNVRLELDGYEPYEIIFSKKISGWVCGNIVFGGVIGLAVDAISGGIYKLTPEQVQAELRSNCMTCSKKSEDSFIGVVLQADPSWEKIGTLIAAN